MTTCHAIRLAEALLSDGPAADRADKMGLYGWLVGDWEMDYVYHLPRRPTRKGQGEIHFGWVLQGRAIQDVWRIPGRNPGPDDPSKSLMYGTTLRIYDPGIDAWHIIWSDPVKQYYSRQIGRARRRRHRPGRHRCRRHAGALALYRDQAGLLPLARRAFGRRRHDLAAGSRVLRPARRRRPTKLNTEKNHVRPYFDRRPRHRRDQTLLRRRAEAARAIAVSATARPRSAMAATPSACGSERRAPGYSRSAVGPAFLLRRARRARASRLSTRRRWRPAARENGKPGLRDRLRAGLFRRLSSSTPTATGSKPIAPQSRAEPTEADGIAGAPPRLAL